MKLVKSNTEPTMRFDSMLDHLFNDNFLNWTPSPRHRHGANQPAFNLMEDEHQWSIELAVPGMAKEDFKIDLNEDVLNISAEKSHSKEEKSENYKVRQFSFESFNKSFRLPENSVMEDAISAQYENGVLKLTLPKKEEEKSTYKREISVA